MHRMIEMHSKYDNMHINVMFFALNCIIKSCFIMLRLHVINHLSRLHISGGEDIGDTFPDEHLLAISSHTPWYAHIVNFIVTGSISEHWNRHQKDKFFHELKY